MLYWTFGCQIKSIFSLQKWIQLQPFHCSLIPLRPQRALQDDLRERRRHLININLLINELIVPVNIQTPNHTDFYATKMNSTSTIPLLVDVLLLYFRAANTPTATVMANMLMPNIPHKRNKQRIMK